MRCVWIVLLFNGGQGPRRRAIETILQCTGEQTPLNQGSDLSTRPNQRFREKRFQELPVFPAVLS